MLTPEVSSTILGLLNITFKRVLVIFKQVRISYYPHDSLVIETLVIMDVIIS